MQSGDTGEPVYFLSRWQNYCPTSKPARYKASFWKHAQSHWSCTKGLTHVLNQGRKTMPRLPGRERKGNLDDFIVNCQEFRSRGWAARVTLADVAAFSLQEHSSGELPSEGWGASLLESLALRHHWGTLQTALAPSRLSSSDLVTNRKRPYRISCHQDLWGLNS